MSDKINDILTTDFTELPSTNDIYNSFIAKSKIEELKEEMYVVDQLVKGKSKKAIVQDLKMKYPEKGLSMYDLNKFMERNDSLTKELQQKNNALARRHLNAKVKLEEELAQLYMFTKDLSYQYKEEKDNQSTLIAIRTLSDLIMKFSKLAGFWGDDSHERPQNVINIVTDQKSDVAKKIIRADFNMVKQNEENHRTTEEKSQNKETDNK